MRYGLKAASLIFIAFFGISFSGCATLITGPNQKISITSIPIDAKVEIDGKDNYRTPVKVKLKRNRDHTLVFTKEGYKDETVKLLHVLSGAIAGNTVIFGIAGLAVDNLSGAQFKLIPTSVHAEMKKNE